MLYLPPPSNTMHYLNYNVSQANHFIFPKLFHTFLSIYQSIWDRSKHQPILLTHKFLNYLTSMLNWNTLLITQHYPFRIVSFPLKLYLKHITYLFTMLSLYILLLRYTIQVAYMKYPFHSVLRNFMAQFLSLFQSKLMLHYVNYFLTEFKRLIIEH